MMPCKYLLLLAWPLAATAGQLPIIQCPLKNKTRYFDMIINAKEGSQYCAPVSVRQCRDESGCVGVKYQNASTLYESCGEYMNKKASGPYPTLPAIVRIDAGPSGALSRDGDGLAKYLEFVCDPAPGVSAVTTAEYWPPAGYGWQSSIPISKNTGMISLLDPVCSPNDSIVRCGYTSITLGDGYCCMRCNPRDGNVINTTVHNQKDYAIKVNFNIPGSKYSGTTCSASAHGQPLVIPPFGTKKFSFPIEVVGGTMSSGALFEFVPMHHAGAPLCYFEQEGGASPMPLPKEITVGGPNATSGVLCD